MRDPKVFKDSGEEVSIPNFPASGKAMVKVFDHNVRKIDGKFVFKEIHKDTVKIVGLIPFLGWRNNIIMHNFEE